MLMHLSVHVEAGQGLLGVNSNSHPADVFVDGWERAKPVAFDSTVTSPLLLPLWMMLVNQQELQLIQQCRKHSSNDPKCQELGRSVFPLLLKRMAIGVKRPKTPSRDWHLSFQSASAAQSLRSFRRFTVGSISL